MVLGCQYSAKKGTIKRAECSWGFGEKTTIKRVPRHYVLSPTCEQIEENIERETWKSSIPWYVELCEDPCT